MSIRILIADDHAVFRCGLRAFLEKEEDFTIVGDVGSGQDALNALEKSQIDVLILDLTMPGIPGPRVAEAALKLKPDLAIVVLTMHEDEYYMQELFKIGARAYVLKSSTGTELVQAIRAASRGENFIDPCLTGHVLSSYVGQKSRRGKPSRLDELTPREKEVLMLLAYGHTNAEIAQRLFISERTVESHRNHLMTKLELHTRAELVHFAIDHGLLKLN